MATLPRIDLTGQVFGRLTVLPKTEVHHSPSGSSSRHWLCRCECGNETMVSLSNLKAGCVQSCGCLRAEANRSRMVDVIGQRFGRLVVLDHSEKSKPKKRRLLCRCDCGNLIEPTYLDLSQGDTRSCGCLLAEIRVSANRTHGMSKTRSEYDTWGRMIQRCTNPKRPDHFHYGGRGITVCERWRSSFTAFLEDMGPRPSTGHSLDRIDNDGNYEPGNCRWATQKEQKNNTRWNHFVEMDGETRTLSQWAEQYGIPYGAFRQRTHQGWTIEAALTTPFRDPKEPLRLTYQGETLTVVQWSKRLGIDKGTLQGRLRKGWSVEDALGKPVRKVRSSPRPRLVPRAS